MKKEEKERYDNCELVLVDYKLLSAIEIAELTGFGYKKALELMKSSGFPAIRIGNEYRVSVKDYKKWCNQCKGKTVKL